eukprot:6197865-Pleurochrysis_carterae.AAC.1
MGSWSLAASWPSAASWSSAGTRPLTATLAFEAAESCTLARRPLAGRVAAASDWPHKPALSVWRC